MGLGRMLNACAEFGLYEFRSVQEYTRGTLVPTLRFLDQTLQEKTRRITDRWPPEVSRVAKVFSEALPFIVLCLIPNVGASIDGTLIGIEVSMIFAKQQIASHEKQAFISRLSRYVNGACFAGMAYNIGEMIVAPCTSMPLVHSVSGLIGCAGWLSVEAGWDKFSREKLPALLPPPPAQTG
jgi:hypothetical protein